MPQTVAGKGDVAGMWVLTGIEGNSFGLRQAVSWGLWRGLTDRDEIKPAVICLLLESNTASADNVAGDEKIGQAHIAS